MNRKQLIGLVLFVVGVCLGIFSKYELNRIEKMSGEFTAITSLFKRGDDVNDELQKKLASYHGPLEVVFYGSLVLIVGGGVLFFVFKDRK